MPRVFLNGGNLDRPHEVDELLPEIVVEGMKFRPQTVGDEPIYWLPGVPYYLLWWEPSEPSGRAATPHTTQDLHRKK